MRRLGGDRGYSEWLHTHKRRRPATLRGDAHRLDGEEAAAMTEDEMIEAIRGILDDLVGRVELRVPSALAVARYDGAMQPYASFAASAASESIDLCVRLTRQSSGVVECTADLVRGGSGDVLDEMPSVTIRNVTDPADVRTMLEAVRGFCASQDGQVVHELQRG